MKFGLTYTVMMPEPHYPGMEQEYYKQTMAQAELADELGYDYFWAVEHHFLKGLAHCSAPEVLLGAVSQRTRRIRIGHAVVLLPHRYNHPIRVAERAAVLDIVSDGRMELGTGRGYTLVEMGAFEIDPEETQEQWAEAISIIPRMWTEDPFSHEGHYYKIPPRSIIPKPVQKPHPPLWVACTQPATVKRAGEMGLGALCFSGGSYEEKAERVSAYREGIKHAQPVGAFVNDQMAMMATVHCEENDADAKAAGIPAGMWFLDKMQEFYRPWHQQGVTVPDSYKFQIGSTQERQSKTAEEYMESGAFALGDPDTCIKAVKQYEAAGVDQFLCLMQFGDLPHAKVMESIRLFGKYVIPYFR